MYIEASTTSRKIYLLFFFIHFFKEMGVGEIRLWAMEWTLKKIKAMQGPPTVNPWPCFVQNT